MQALPDDLKTKLSIDDDLASSPKEALSRASADRVAMRNKLLKRFSFAILLLFLLKINLHLFFILCVV